MNLNDFTYWAYYTLGNQQPPYEIHLARSNSLTSGWVDYGKVFDGRWPSVYYDGETFHMIYRDGDNDAAVLKYATSSDGLSWTFSKSITTTGNNNNPFLWKNPNDNLWYLFNHEQYATGNRINYRKAAAITDLDASDETTILDWGGVIASPNMLYKDGLYWLSVEKYPNSIWTTDLYYSSNIDGPYYQVTNNPVLGNNDACNMQLPLGAATYCFYAEMTDTPNNYWDVVVRTFA